MIGFVSGQIFEVLILVLVEVPIGELMRQISGKPVIQVLILVLVEVPIGVYSSSWRGFPLMSLNPCFSGSSYRSGEILAKTCEG